jgi:hypothetical protein
MATGFQTYKTINNGCTLSMYRSECLVVSGAEEGKASFEVPCSGLVGVVSLFQKVKGVFPLKDNIAYIFRIEQWKKLCLVFPSIVTYFKNP